MLFKKVSKTFLFSLLILSTNLNCMEHSVEFPSDVPEDCDEIREKTFEDPTSFPLGEKKMYTIDELFKLSKTVNKLKIIGFPEKIIVILDNLSGRKMKLDGKTKQTIGLILMSMNSEKWTVENADKIWIELTRIETFNEKSSKKR